MNVGCFTGHREIRPDDERDLPILLAQCVEELAVQRDMTCFRCGGARGFDTVAALAVLAVKERCPSLGVRLELFLPCRDQTKGWREEDRRRYDEILKRADRVVYASQEYTRTCMHLRNRMLVDGSDLCIAYIYESHGGTFYTCTYAREHHVPVLNVVRILRDRRRRAAGGATR